MGRLQSLQALRFFAALAVLLDHSTLEVLARTGHSAWRGVPMDIGGLGVHVFFAISGFIMVHAVLARPVSAGQFMLDRWWRIAPLYLLATALYAPLAPGNLTWERIAATLTFWPAWGAHFDPVLTVGWTLCFEMLFYVCLALIRLNRAFLPVLLAAFVGCWIGSDLTGSAALGFLGNPTILEFIAGAVLGLVWTERRRPVVGACLILAAIVWFGVVLTLGRPDMGGGIGSPLPRVFVFLPPAVAILYGALQFERCGAVLPYLGDASYALYLVHTIVLTCLRLLPAGMWPLIVPLTIALSIGLAIALHERIEKPLARHRPKLSMQPSPSGTRRWSAYNWR